MGALAKLDEGLGLSAGVTSVSNALAQVDQTIGVTAISKGLADVDKALGLSTTVTALAKNPLPTLATIGLTMIGVPAPIASAMVTAAQGGSMEDVLKGAAMAYIGGKVGDVAGKAFAGTDFATNTLSPELSATLKTIVTSASGDSAVAALQGRPLNDVLAAGMNSAITGYVTQGLTKQLGLTDPKALDTKLTQSAISSATQAILNGKDIGKAITASVVQTALSEGIKTGVDKLVKNSETLQGLQTDFNNAKQSASDYLTKTLNPQYDTVKSTYATATASRSAVQAAAADYQAKYDKYTADKAAAEAYVQPSTTTPGYYDTVNYGGRRGAVDTWHPAETTVTGSTKQQVIDAVNAQVPAVEAAVTNFNNVAAKAATDTAAYESAVANYNPLKSAYEGLVNLATGKSNEITAVNTDSAATLRDVGTKTTAFEAETAKQADVVASEEAAVVAAKAKEIIADTAKTEITNTYKETMGREPTADELKTYMESDAVKRGDIEPVVDTISTSQEAKNYDATTNGVDSTKLETEAPVANQAITDWFNRSNIVKGSWDKAATDAFNKDMIKSSEDFGTAYALARTAYGSNKTFEWTNPNTGKTSSFTTNTKEEVALQPFDATSMSRSGLGGAAQAALDAGKTAFTWADGKTYKVPDAYAFLKGADQSSAENKRLLESGVAEVKSNGQTALDNVIGKMGEGAGSMIEGFGKAMALATGDANYKNAVITAGNMLSQWGENKSSGTALATETANVLAGVAAAEKSDNPFTAAAIVGKAVLNNPIGILGMVGSETTQEGIQHVLGGAAGVLVGGLVSMVATPVAGTAAGLATYKGVMALTEGIMVFGEAGQEIETKLTKQGVSPEQARNAALMGASGAALVAIPAEYIADKAILGAYMDGIKGGIKEFAVKYGTSTATQVVSGMVEGASQSAITQYATTGKVNMTAAATGGYFEAIIGAATGAAMVTPAGIKDLTVIGKDFSGSNVTFRDFLSGDKTVNPDTFNTSISLGKSASGSDLTLGSFTAMGMNVGFDTEMLSNILPPSLTGVDTIVGTDPQGKPVTFGQLSAITQNGTDPDAANLVGNLFADTQYVTQAEAKAEFANAGITNPTPEQLATYVGQKDQTTTLPEIKTTVAANAVTNETALTTAIKDLKATGMSDAQVAAAVADAAKGAVTNTPLDAAVAGLKSSGLSPEQITSSVTTVATGLAPATLTDITKATAATQAQIAGVSADVQTKYDALTTAQKAEVDARVQQGLDLNAAINAASTTTAAGFTKVQQTLAEQQAAAATQRAADLAESEKQREIDRTTAAANAEAQRQMGLKAAATATRRAQIGRATTQTGNVLSDLKQQAAAMRAAPTIAPEVVQASPGFDFSQPLNTGFFSGYAQQQKTNQLQPGTAKIATGGYLDDLLNAIR